MQCVKKRKLDEIECVDVAENEMIVSPPHKKQMVQYEQNDVDVDDDAAWMEDNVIDRVNTYCLAHIFKHIPPFERPKVAQVCKKWREALPYSWSNVKKLECLHWKYDGVVAHRGSRKVICLKGLIDQCGRYLTELNTIHYDNSDIVPLIRISCPHLVRLQLRFKNIKSLHFKDAFSYMSKLQILRLIFQCSASIPILLILALRDLTRTLKTLAFFNWKRNPRNQKMPALFSSVFSQMTTLRFFDLFGYQFPDQYA
ncbi:uncharacterized protein LOC122847841 [Aphidius gifuensis]|uniref:uncharacterized protein LOC122847841 n=1 Tax=Aphidius gifuensis TaxID=684658 RepID=UPI001CDCF7D3|nr:uncharacterized protein LOC122847841 [Aphidius gifuensis]